ncbi:MAG: protein kinase [Candidatus Zixiibacteriota bacterium]
MIGQVLSHYRITKHIASGGMGDLYLALDLNLGREVAVKVLSAAGAADPEARRRFVQEAKAQAMLNHPNIATFLDAGEEGESAFIVMEFIAGMPLSEYLKSRELSPVEALDVAIQVASGLEAAHEVGVIHRDIKPENIMISETGQVKITDFGLARRQGATTITKTGTLMGTAYYMSPEQAEGKTVDRRSDIFSLGVVLYELLCRRRPFEGGSDAAVLFEVTFGEPQPLSRYCRGATPELERIVTKALAKRPEERYQTAADMLSDLRQERRLLDSGPHRGISITRRARRIGNAWWLVAAAVGVMLILAAIFRGSIAPRRVTRAGAERLVVLPFDNLGPPEKDYFADGITDEITSQLARATNLQVISRTSATRYKDTNKTIREIAQELNVDYVLEGTIRWEQALPYDRVRIIPQLIRTSDDSHVWSNEYEQGLERVLAAQTEIAGEVARAMGAVLSGQPGDAAKAPATTSPEAFDLYLRGSEYFNRGFRQDDLRIATELLALATHRDSTFAQAYARLSRTYSRTHWYWARGNPADSNVAHARTAYETALRLAPDLAEAHLARGFYRYWCERDFAGALESFAVTRALEPNNVDVQFAVAGVLRRQGQFDSAVSLLRLASSLDPLSSDKIFEVGNTLYRTRDCAGADSAFARAITLAPDQPYAYARRALNAVNCDGDTKRARAILAGAGAHVDTTILGPTAFALDLLDRDYESALRRITARPGNVPYYHLSVAQVYRLMGRTQLAQVYSDSARILLERDAGSLFADPERLTDLGLAMAGLGRKDSAIALGEQAVSITPIHEDAFGGPLVLEKLAQICLIAGDYDCALDQLEILLERPSQVSARLIAIDPDWDPVHDNPRYQQIIDRYGGGRR